MIVNKENVKVIIDDLKDKKVVAIPTDTVYGVASIIEDEAIMKLFELKKRENKPIAVLAYNKEQFLKVVDCLDEHAIRLIDKYLPGPLTLVMKKKEGLSDTLTQGLDTVGVRIPNDKITLSILKEVGPLAVTSANLSGEPPINTTTELEKKFPEISILEGEVKLREASTVILMSEPLRVLREGPLKLEDLI